MLLHAEHISKAYTDKPLLSDLSLTISEGEKAALIGVNGCGKSTLLKILAGRETSEGTVEIPGNVRTEILMQNPVFEEDTIWQQMLYQNSRNVVPLEEFELKTILTKLGIGPELFESRIDTLSGGTQRKVALASALAVRADLLFLDEPTNHLDADMVEWLESFLNRYKGAVLMVTHDRYFLERVCTRILEIDRGSLYEHQGSYQTYLENKEQRRTQLEQAAAKHKNLYRKELEWVRAGCQARSTKSRSRLERFEELRKQRFDLQQQKLELLSTASRLGKKTLAWENLSFGYDHTLFHDFSYQTKRTDRIGLCGSNGAGKTTLLKLLAGELQPDTGTIEQGSTVKIGYFRQDHEIADLSMRVLDYIEETSRVIDTGKGVVSASAMLERFLFDKDKQYLPIERLSGGERRRLYLLKILMGSPNLLLLDEPTNDLDLVTLEILEDYLDEFPGIVIAVSHDRYFLDRVCTSLFALQPDGIWKPYVGGYTDWMAHKEEEKKNSRPEASSRQSWKKNRKPALSWQEKKELEALPDELACLEAEVEACNKAMENQSDFEKLSELCSRRDEAQAKLESREERWLELMEKQEAC